MSFFLNKTKDEDRGNFLFSVSPRPSRLFFLLPFAKKLQRNPKSIFFALGFLNLFCGVFAFRSVLFVSWRHAFFSGRVSTGDSKSGKFGCAVKLVIIKRDVGWNSPATLPGVKEM